MKNYILAIMIMTTFSSCYNEPSGFRDEKDGYSIITIDSCEYIEVSYMKGFQEGYYSLTHKGNCKLCLERFAK